MLKDNLVKSREMSFRRRPEAGVSMGFIYYKLLENTFLRIRLKRIIT